MHRNNITPLRFLLAPLLALLPALSATAVQASEQDGGWFDTQNFGMSMMEADYELDGIGNVPLRLFDFRYNVELLPRVAVEFRYGYGINGTTRDGCGYDGGVYSCSRNNVLLDNFRSIHARGSLYEDAGWQLYGVTGYTSASVSVEDGNETSVRSHSGLSYGLGFETGGETARFTLEYGRIVKSDTASLDALSAGFLLQF